MTDTSIIEQLGRKYDSFYLYNENIIKQSINELKDSFPGIDFLYSIKCNPEKHVLKSVFCEGFGADAASYGEVVRAKEAGLAADRIYFSAPGKTSADIERAIGESVIIADSLNEIEKIDAIAGQKGINIAIGVRINPSFSYYGEIGTAGASKFGIDEDQLIGFIKDFPYKNVRINGIHVHLKSQELDASAIVNYYKKVTALTVRISKALGAPLDYVNMGSGIGITFSSDDRPIDIKKLGSDTLHALKDFCSSFPMTRVIIETGRYVSGKSGTYVTKVIDKKVSHGTTYLILKNTLNGFVRPSVINMALLHSQGSVPAPWEPMFTCVGAFRYKALKEGPADEKVTLVGNLCTSTDMVAQDIMMPHMEIGDLIMMDNAGAYAAVMSPMQFASLEPPKELFLTTQGKILGE